MTATAPQQEFQWGKRPTDTDTKLIPLEKIHVPAEYEREDSPREDEALTNSIRRHGVQQPIHVIQDGSQYTLVKGSRRLAISYVCRYPKIPAIIEPPAPEGTDPVTYRNRLRFHLTIRQDLSPSQRAEFIVQTMNQFQMNQKQIAQYLGVDPGSISGWLAIRDYHPSIVNLINEGKITLFAARAFDGVKTEMQPRIYKALRREFETLAGGKVHKLVRTKFSPQRHADYYDNPGQTLEKLARRQTGRKSRKRPKLTKSEKEILATDLTVRESELKDLQDEIRQLRRVNQLAAPIVNAIMRNSEIADSLPPDMRDELVAFSQAY